MDNINTAIIERLERVVDSLQDNSVKMGQLLAVHNEKLDKQDKVDEVLFEKLDNLNKDFNRETRKSRGLTTGELCKDGSTSCCA